MLSVGYAYGSRLIGESLAVGVVVRREQTYSKPEVLAPPVALVITNSFADETTAADLVLVLFVLSHLLSGLSCPCSASAAAVKRTMRMTRMVRIDRVAKQSRNQDARQHNKRPATFVTGLGYAVYAVWMRIIPRLFLTRWGKHLKLDHGPMPRQ